MASISATLPSPLSFAQRKSNLTSNQKLPFCLSRGTIDLSPSPLTRNHSSISIALMVKASGESSESSTDLDVLSSIQNGWDNSEDRLGLIGLTFSAIVALWASLNLITAIDKLPVISTGFELVGILFSTWFTYRYLLFKPDREELSKIVKKSVADVLGK
ncbi:PREDICTED: protein CURVATURE THYLAKOID 1C, chloroplastic [Camelina sativa]|uniref:Protein CURVATURE THYLAKOID 1C, chloroplastic n=1 Tax=Camelina sativa TaxID=90675 RepID=A0ABM0X2Q5_CAMSA|nr:PREDICTED: protein CURVATURE THYLAKOID 1C, chloroplastic [Camelina sativa]